MLRILFFLICFIGLTARAQVFDFVISKDADGAYRTIQSAIGRLPGNSPSTVRVFIENGVYEEKVHLPADKSNISFIGESTEGVIITWNDHAGMDGVSTASSYTFLAEGNDFYAENITIGNTAGNVAQAVAIRTTGDRQVFKNCRFLGFQDTYYAHKNRQYNFNCYVEGATDFIFGDATTVFDSCTIQCVSGGQYITAPADTKLTSTIDGDSTFLHGLLFTNSEITRDTDVNDNSYYLGRPWQPNASSVYINCRMDDHIKPEGWSTWNDNTHLSSFFAEYNSMTPDNSTIDTSNRADWSYQLTSSDVANYYSLNYFFKKEDVEWDPVPTTIALEAPQNLTADAMAHLTWDVVDEATGYAILRNDSVIGFSETNEYTDESLNTSMNNEYRVKSVASYGNLSEESNAQIVESTTAINELTSNKRFKITMQDNFLRFPENCDIRLYQSNGQLVTTQNNISRLSTRNLANGTYVLSITTQSGQIFSQKFVNR